MSLLNNDQQDENNYEEITRIFNTDTLFQCPLCKSEFQDPRILCSNGHTFCLHCIQNALSNDGILKCPICKENHCFSDAQDMEKLVKNHTIHTLKRAERHRIAQIGTCGLCHQKAAYGRCFHCHSLACFKCMEMHERILTDEFVKEYDNLIKLRNKLQTRLLQWDKTVTESRDRIHQLIHMDAKKQIKEIHENEQTLYSQLDELYENNLTNKNLKLQKIKFDIEKESNELNRIDVKRWNSNECSRLNQYWIDLEKKLDDMSIDFAYKPIENSSKRPYLGEIGLQQQNHQADRIEKEKSSLNVNRPDFDQSTQINSEPIFNDTTPKIPEPIGSFPIIRPRLLAIDRNQRQQRLRMPSNIKSKLSKPTDNERNLTPRIPFSPVFLNHYKTKAARILSGLNEADKFLEPKSVAVTDTNHLLITDAKKHRLIIYDINSKAIRAIKGFLYPDGLCLATEHYVIITDHHRISKYDWLNNKMISFIGTKKEGCTHSTFSWPRGVTIDYNYVYVCDSYNSRIVVLTHQMRYYSEWIICRETKKLDPQYMSISNGLLYVTAWQRIKPESYVYNNGCIIVYDTNGSALNFIDTNEIPDLHLAIPEGILCDNLNQLILTDRYRSKIRCMNNDSQKKIIDFHGDRMKIPHYVCFTNDQRVMIIADIGNNTVQFYEKDSNIT